MVRFAALAAVLILAIGCTAEGQTLDASNEGARVSLDPGGQVEVLLEGNATTGFTWDLADHDPAVIALQGEPVYEETTTDVVGAGGTWRFMLVGQEPGECEVRFIYHRTWEDEPPEQTFSFTAVVDQ